MLDRKEKLFVEYWETNREREKNIIYQVLTGLPIGLLFALPIIFILFTGRYWFKRADMVANSELAQGDWHKAFTLKEDLHPITPADVNKVFNKYIGNFTWVYQGDTTKVTPKLYTQKQTPPVPKDKKAF